MRSLRRDEALSGYATHRRGILLGALSWLSGFTPAIAGQCQEDLRTIQLDGTNAVRLRDYNCSTNSGQVRFQLQRLNHAAVGSLFSGTMPPRLAAVLGDPAIVENDIYTEFQYIIDHFAHTLGEGNSLEILLETPRAGTGLRENLGDLSNYQLAMLHSSLPLHFPQPPNITRLAGQSQVPPGYRRIAQRLIWKYMTALDIAAFERNLRGQNQGFGRNQPLSREMMELLTKDLGLIQYIARRGWPEDLIVILGELGLDGNDGCQMDFQFFPRELLVDVALIENTGSETITLANFRGTQSAIEALRPLAPQGRGTMAARPIDMTDIRLAPGGSVVVPLRLLFASTEFLKSHLERESGRDKPKQFHYVYGPERSIASFAVNGEQVDLIRPSANHLALNISYGEHCCPYLFVWDPRNEQWKMVRKVISEANGRNLEATSVIAFDGLASRFRLGELEPERAAIAHVKLDVEFQDGRFASLSLDEDSLPARQRGYWTIYYGEHIEFAFLTEGLTASSVKRSLLSVTGYYERYQGLMPVTFRRYESAVALQCSRENY